MSEALAVSPIEAKVFVEADIGGACRGTSRQAEGFYVASLIMLWVESSLLLGSIFYNADLKSCSFLQ